MKDPIRTIPATSQDIMNFITRNKADQQLHAVIQFSGQLQDSLMAKAMRIIMDLEPVLGCRFEERPNRAVWVRRTDLDDLPLYQVIDTQDTQEELMTFVTTPSDPCFDPLIQARVFRERESDTLCVKVNHVAADGVGSKEIVYLIAEVYSRLCVDPGYSPGIGQVKKRSQFPMFRNVGLRRILRSFPRQLSLPQPKFRLPFIDSDITRPCFAICKFDPSRFKLLKAYGKAQGATINDLLLTALYRAMCSAGSPPERTPLPIQVAVDLRHFLPPGNDQKVCNLSGALYPEIYFRPGESFEETLNRVKAEMRSWKSRQPGLTGAIMLELVMLQGYQRAKRMIQEITTRQSEYVNPLILSNLGMLDAGRLAFSGIPIRAVFGLGPVMLGS